MPPKVQPGDETFEDVDFPSMAKQAPRTRRTGVLLVLGALALLAAAVAGRRGRDK